MPEDRTPPRRYLSHVLVAAVFFAVGGIGGVTAKNQLPSPTPAAVAFSGDGEVRQNSSAFQFINPLLECDVGQDMIGSPKSKPSRERITQLIDDAQTRSAVSHVSVYYRDLNNGPWMGINESERFAPASLLKVPIVMTFYKRAETDPTLLSSVVTLQGERQPMSQYFKPELAIEIGGSYTVRELTEHAIRHSDNDAVAALLAMNIGDGLQQLFTALHIDPVTLEGDIITVKDYATFFRVLFNGSYLTNESSELVLQMLSQTDFNQGLTAQLPRDIEVAHKFGERFDYGRGSEKQLHDCGIVYVPKNPYLLCIMTRGENLDQMAGVIADISKAVYDEVTTQQ